MPKSPTIGNLALTGYADIFQSTVTPMNGESVAELPLDELFAPEFHPFLVTDDEAMDRLVKSVKEYGVREPGLARPRDEGGYELLCGNRRKRACEIAGIATMPVIVRTLDDDSAAITMVDSNLEQREKLLPSEKAWAYRVKLEAMNHRGSKSETPGQLSVEVLCKQTGESKNTIFRLIRLTELVPGLLDKVDAKRLALYPAVELSFLTRTEQSNVVDTLARHEIKPSLSQAQRMKKASQEGGLSLHEIESILSEPKRKTSEKAAPAIADYRRFFPNSYTDKQMDAVMTELLTSWQAGQSAINERGAQMQ